MAAGFCRAAVAKKIDKKIHGEVCFWTCCIPITSLKITQPKMLSKKLSEISRITVF